jgi:acetyl-CoA C-acetyltransferase
MRDVFIASAVRTPIGTFGGAFQKHTPVDLAAPAMRAALDRADVDGAALDLFIFGNVLRGGHGQLVPRQAAIQAGIPDSIDGYAVDMVCSSGMMSLINAATTIKAGEADLVLAGGTESMSTAGFALSSKARWGLKMLLGNGEPLIDLMQRDGLTDPFDGDAMGVQTERLADERDVSREELDAVAAESHRRAAEATRSGAFAEEITPVEYTERRETKTLDTDEGIREGTTTEKLGELSPAFQKGGVLTAGNASQISDGAAALVVASEDALDAHGLRPLAKLSASAWSAGEPYRFPEAPLPAAEDVADDMGLAPSDFDLVENNEAFALNTVLIDRQLGVDRNRLNVHGGAIALGHPIGCSGARIVVTLVHALRQRDGATGLAAICHGTGGGTALAVERG